MEVGEIGCVAGQVDEDDIAPDVAAHFDEAERLAVDGRMHVLAGAADMRCGLQRTVEIIAPGVVGAADRTADWAFLVDQDHAAMAADIHEDAHDTVTTADGDERLAEHVDWLGMAVLRQVLGEGDGRPRRMEDSHLLGLMMNWGCVMRIGQSGCLFHGSRDATQGVGVQIWRELHSHGPHSDF